MNKKSRSVDKLAAKRDESYSRNESLNSIDSMQPYGNIIGMSNQKMTKKSDRYKKGQRLPSITSNSTISPNNTYKDQKQRHNINYLSRKLL